MERNVICVGIDVDERYHGSALDKRTGEVLDFQCRPTLKGLVQQLEKVHQYFSGADLMLCYEASYVGFSLQLDLKGRGYHCEVVAPSSIPRRGGKSVKTDRIDATELAEFYANGLLTVVAKVSAAASTITGHEGMRLTVLCSELTQGREAGLIPGTVSLAAARPSHYNFRSNNAFSATMAPRSREIPRSTAAIHGEHAD